MTIQYTKHLTKQAARRGITPIMLDAVKSFGDTLRADGSLYFFMGKRAVKRMLKVYQPRNPDRYLGLTLVCDPSGTQGITVYKNRNWPRAIRHKR